MKIKKLKLDNFFKFTNFEIEFDNKITRLCGMNGAGKTTIGLTAIWAGIKGIADRVKAGQMAGERFRFIGTKKKSSDIEITLVDEKYKNEIVIKNHITSAGNNITFQATNGKPIDDKWINEFLNVNFLSAKHFCSLSPQQQAIEMGIDTAKFDAELKEVKAEYTLINRDLKALGEVTEVEKVESVDVNALWQEKDKIREFNDRQDQKEENLKICKDNINEMKDKVQALKKQIVELESEIEKETKLHDGLPVPKELKTTEEIDEKIESADEINEKAEAYKTYLKDKEKQEKIKDKLNKNKERQKTIEKNRLQYIMKKNLPFSDLTIDDSGGLMLKGRPVSERYFSKGELEIVVAKLYAYICSGEGALKMRFIDDFDLLDDEKGTALVKSLIEDGFQIITAEVGEKRGENIIILRECNIIDAKRNEIL